MSLHFSDNLPSTGAVHVVVMCGPSVSYSFCMYVCTLSLLRMQSLHAQRNLCVCVYVCVCVYMCVVNSMCPHVHMCVCVCLCNLISHLEITKCKWGILWPRVLDGHSDAVTLRPYLLSSHGCFCSSMYITHWTSIAPPSIVSCQTR